METIRQLQSLKILNRMIFEIENFHKGSWFKTLRIHCDATLWIIPQQYTIDGFFKEAQQNEKNWINGVFLAACIKVNVTAHDVYFVASLFSFLAN
jgi:hypothetical protein